MSLKLLIRTGSINRDHVSTRISILRSRVPTVQYLKGKSAHKLLSEYRTLRTRYGASICGRGGCRIATSGSVTDGVWIKHIEDQKANEPDNHFKVLQANPAFAADRSGFEPSQEAIGFSGGRSQAKDAEMESLSVLIPLSYMEQVRCGSRGA